jgi:hypothetical protein
MRLPWGKSQQVTAKINEKITDIMGVIFTDKAVNFLPKTSLAKEILLRSTFSLEVCSLHVCQSTTLFES